MNGAVSRRMCSSHGSLGPQGVYNLRLLSRGKFANHISQGAIHIRFVEGNPELTEVTDFSHYVACEPFKQALCVGRKKRSLLFEPQWMTEVMQRDYGLNSA